MLGKTRRIHFIGIGGIGMSGIAELLVNLGYSVSGSDARRTDLTDRLGQLGITVHVGHAASHVGDADVVVYSSAIRDDNPEMTEARQRHVPVIPRAEMLAELMRLRSGIAVAGAHGKTSTTSMIALVLEQAGLDPTAVIGGKLSAFGSNARLGRGEWMVVEADESDRSFLRLSPTVAVITNIDREHMEAYGSYADLESAFVEFAGKVPFYGAVVACADDEALQAILPRLSRRTVTYGIDHADAQLSATDVVLEGFGSHCRVIRRPAHRAGTGEVLGELHLQVPGRHSVLNALAAVAVALELDVPFARIAEALAGFRGADRRFQRVGEVNGVVVIVLAAARAARPARIVLAFQPHRYTRTRDLLPEFARTLATADEVVLTDIYPASEAPIPGVTIEALAAAVTAERGTPVQVVHDLSALPAAVARLARAGDLVITLGAGSIGGTAARIVAALSLSPEHGGPA